MTHNQRTARRYDQVKKAEAKKAAVIEMVGMIAGGIIFLACVWVVLVAFAPTDYSCEPTVYANGQPAPCLAN